MTSKFPDHPVRVRRTQLGISQSDLANRAGISRTAVTAIEGQKMIPAVSTALAIAAVLETSVEELFGHRREIEETARWAWPPLRSIQPCWTAEVNDIQVCYPATSIPLWTPLPDGFGGKSSSLNKLPQQTLVIAGCDPAAGLLASLFAISTGMRLLPIQRSSGQALEMLRQGLVHAAGLHLTSGQDGSSHPQIVKKLLGDGYHLLRLTHWQTGVAVSAGMKTKSLNRLIRSQATWIGREPGSGARKCLEQLLGNRPFPSKIAQHHRAVAEAVRDGWADAGVCTQLVAEEAGVDFLPVQEEAYDLCFHSSFLADRRMKAFLKLVRCSSFRKHLQSLPGYSVEETGTLLS